MMNMNEDILKGKWLEIKGRVKEKWGKLTGNDLGEIEGKGDKLLGLLRKKYGYIRDKAGLEYKDSVELAEIVSSIRDVMTRKKDIMAIAFIARYGQPLLAKKQESQVKLRRQEPGASLPKISIKEEKHGYDTDRYLGSRPRRRTAHLASQ
jgi:uncharacterized protein YjbJ (UPF0337 family)